MVRYTETEYAQYLHDENWTRPETDYLLDLCQQYELRFFIVHDRWDASRFGDKAAKNRTIDEIKDRYYKVIGVMHKLKTGDDSQSYTFDLEHEQKRREQLEKLFGRTKQQIDEELHLIEELKKIEIRKREREKKQQDVSKLLTAVRDLENTNRVSGGANTLNQQNLLKNRVSNENRMLNQSVGGSSSSSGTANGSNSNNKRIKNRRPFSNDQLNKSLNSTGGATPAGATQTHKSSANLNSSVNMSHSSANNSLNNSTEKINSPSSSASNSLINTSFDKNKNKSLIFKVVLLGFFILN